MNMKRYTLSLILITFLFSSSNSHTSAFPIDTAVKAGSFLISEGKELVHGALATINAINLLNFANSSSKNKAVLLHGIKVGQKIKESTWRSLLYSLVTSPTSLYLDDNRACQEPLKWGTLATVLFVQAYLIYSYAYAEEKLKPFSTFCIENSLTLCLGNKNSAKKWWSDARIKYPLLTRVIEEIPTTLVITIASSALRHGVGSLLCSANHCPLKK